MAWNGRNIQFVKLMYKSITKPILDFVMALLMLFLLAPFFLFIMFLLMFLNKGKVFFLQERPGKNGRLFKLIKFRTMNDKMDSEGLPLPDKDRITAVGRLLRLYSIDELPQLFNVLAGAMSFVGPRPLLTRYLLLYNSQQARRHEVKPGLTGWAQINGRNSITWNEKFRLDIWYVDNICFILDTKIFFITLIRVLSRQGINSTEKSTMPAFNGEN